MESPSKARRVLELANEQQIVKSGAIKKLKMKNSRLTKKVASLQSLLQDIQNKLLITESAKSILEVSVSSFFHATFYCIEINFYWFWNLNTFIKFNLGINTRNTCWITDKQIKEASIKTRVPCWASGLCIDIAFLFIEGLWLREKKLSNLLTTSIYFEKMVPVYWWFSRIHKCSIISIKNESLRSNKIK